MQLNCNVIKKWQPSPPSLISISTPPFSRLSPLSSKTFGPPQVTQFSEGPTPPPTPLIKGGMFPTMRAFKLLQLLFEGFRIPNLCEKVCLITF